MDVNNDFIFWMEQMRLAELRHPAFQVEGDAAEQWERVRTRHTAWGKAPLLIVILGDGRRQWGTVLGAMTFGRHQSHLTDALSNAATLMHLAATSLGLGSQHVTIHVQEPFKRVLGVPDLLMIHHILPIGFSAIDRRPTVRRPLGGIVHYDRYDQGKYMSNRQVLGFLHELRGHHAGLPHPAGGRSLIGICFGLETIMHAAKAMKTVLEDMRAGTFALRDKGMSFEEFKSVVHYERWERLDDLYG